MCNNKKKCSCNCDKNKIIKENLLLQEKINLELSHNKKIELVKQARIAHEAILSIYSLLQKAKIGNEFFYNLLDSTYNKTNEILTVLVVQDEVEENQEKNI